MDLHFYLSTLAIIFVGTGMVFFAAREEKTRIELLEKDRIQKHRIYEILILKEIQDRIGYSLDVEKVIDVITGSLKNLFPYSTTSSLIVKDDRLVFKTFIEEKVGNVYIEQVKKSMFASLSALFDRPLPTRIDESISGALIDDMSSLMPASFFHVPLVVNNSIVGLINISSTKPGLYKEEEMTILYQIINQASSALSKLTNVLTTEKGKLMAMIGSLADGVFMVDVNSQVLVINETAKTFLKIQKENPTILDIVGSMSGVYDFAGKIQKSLTQNLKIEEKEVSLGDKTVQLFITPVSNERGVIGASILLHDITLEKKLTKMKEDFTNIIVHELRAPLVAIKGASELIIESRDKLEDKQQEKLIGVIEEQSKKLLDEVASILDTAKLEAGQFSIHKELSDLKKTISDGIQAFVPSAATKNIEIVTELSETLPQIPFDKSRISQVLNNLLSNSLKFTPEGGKITVSASKDDDYIIISVSDTGIGIPKEKQANLFSKFSQVYTSQPSDLKHLTLGSGLGLYITKAIVEAHGGRIFLKSEVGQGTTISFTLPITTESAVHLDQLNLN